MISFKEVKKLNQKGNVIPVYTRIPADLDTPVSAFIKVTKNKKKSFLLESIEGGEKLARYSFLGCDPFLTLEGYRNKVIVSHDKKKSIFNVPPQEFVKQLFSIYKPVKLDGLPRFTGGAVGYFSYDTIRWVENIPDNNEDKIGLPEMQLGLYRSIIAFDHIKQEIIIISNVLHNKNDKGLKQKYDNALKEIDKLITNLKKSTTRIKESQSHPSRLKAHYSQEEFTRMVRKAKRYIKEGDIFQVVLSQRWEMKSSKSPLAVYRNLRRLNPSPYMFLLNFGKTSIIGSSPEMMVRVENRNIELRPIAGTRPRGKNEKEDLRLIADLLSDEKELAEHTMLLDLGRNDVGRVSIPGSVMVKDKMIIEKYSHVIHIVSSVVGKLSPKTQLLEGLLACFPAGTVSGAPKIRAMEIIDELEKERRSIYAGAITYLDFWGNLDSCIAIRTIIKKENTFYIQAGAGIVADSKPVKKYKETKAKAQVLIEAISGD